MSAYVTLAEAASYLGVSKATLRKWDNEGKLKAVRHPLNRYRVYDLEDLRALKPQASLFDDDVLQVPKSEQVEISDPRSLKRVIGRLHSVLRDTDGDSNIIQRFDELTKLMFLKLLGDQNSVEVFRSVPGETTSNYADSVRRAYAEEAQHHAHLIPDRFARLHCSDAAIRQCGSVLADLSFAAADFDLKGVAYEEMIRGIFDKSDHQQFFTPPQVVRFMAAMCEPFLEGTVGDPACGTGGFLVRVAQASRQVARIVGFEIDERLAWISRINLLLHAAPEFEVRCLGNGAALGPDAKPYLGTFDLILTNPPFGSDVSDRTTLHDFVLGGDRASRRRGILFLERCHEFLKDQGVLAIVMEEGVLNLSSAVDVREFILRHFDVLAVIELPETAFMPYANVNASILLLRKTVAEERSREVFFAKAENIGRRANGDDDFTFDESGTAVPNTDLPAILSLLEERRAGRGVAESELAYVADIMANLDGDNTLRMDFRYHHPSRGRSRELLRRSKYRLWSLADLCQERNETVILSKEMPNQVILYTGLANIEVGNGVAHQVPTPSGAVKSAVKRYQPGDILFARMRPNLRKVALMPFPEGGYCSPECAVLTVRIDNDDDHLIDPQILAVVLRSDLVFGQVMHLIAGIGRPRLSPKDLRGIQIPMPARIVQLRTRHEHEGRLASVRDLRARGQVLLREADGLESRAVEELANSMIGE